jgi:mono/diheme cytochrome c family protein
LQQLQSGQAPALPARLSDTGLYEAGRPGVVDARHRPFAPQYPLWTDGAAKARWIALPPDATIDATDPTGWRFPVGTKFWKEFSFDGRKVETRFLWRATDDRWLAASYVWDDEQSDAALAPVEGLPRVAEVAPGRWHAIPSQTDCLACHGSKPTTALGFNLLQLSPDRDPNALHAEPLKPAMTTLATLTAEGLIAPLDPSWATAPPRITAANPRTRAMLGYFAANCGSCHNDRGEIAVLGPSLAFKDVMADGDAVAARLIGHATKWQVPGVTEGESALISRVHPDRSAMLVRMQSRRPSSQMPPLGTVVEDEQAIAALRTWIAAELAASHSRTTRSDER